jgi:transcriptional regulator with XRE-family HTH domain
MTVNQLVAYNLRRIRERRGLTQESAADLLEPFLGRRWSKATFSAAETSLTSGRTREFSADDILAFAIVFDVPVGWFFLPPNTDEEHSGENVTMGGMEARDAGALVDAVAPVQNSDMLERFAALGREDRNVAIDRITGSVTDAVRKALAGPHSPLAIAMGLAHQSKEKNDG